MFIQRHVSPSLAVRLYGYLLLCTLFLLAVAGCLNERTLLQSGKAADILKAYQCDILVTWFNEELRAWPMVVYYSGDGPDRTKTPFLKPFHVTAKEMKSLLHVLRPRLESQHDQETWMGISVTSDGNEMYAGIPTNAKGLAFLDALAKAVRRESRAGLIMMRERLAGRIKWEIEGSVLKLTNSLEETP